MDFGGPLTSVNPASVPEMNRHHYSLYVHNCRLVFLLRRDFTLVDTFRPAEFHWKLEQVGRSAGTRPGQRRGEVRSSGRPSPLSRLLLVSKRFSDEVPCCLSSVAVALPPLSALLCIFKITSEDERFPGLLKVHHVTAHNESPTI